MVKGISLKLCADISALVPT